jgi:16S rRNA (cytosine967-C5)-methyltransferase
VNFSEMEEYKNGEFEIQDESSQITSDTINPKPGDTVIDYCAGSGGKSLGNYHFFLYK